MSRSALVLVCLAVLAVGCRKKSSDEFFKLEAEATMLVDREGDDAWLSADMERIAAGLAAVPENTLEKDRAVALVAKIRAEQRRLEAERKADEQEVAAREKRAANQPGPSFPRDPEPLPAPVAVDAGADAGPPSEPWAGMDEKTFLTLFGKCVASAPAMALPDGGAATAHRVRDEPACQKRFGAPPAETFFLFGPGGLWGRTQRTTTTVTVDAGVVTTQPPPAPPPLGEKILTLPGAPIPEGYKKAE